MRIISTYTARIHGGTAKELKDTDYSIFYCKKKKVKNLKKKEKKTSHLGYENLKVDYLNSFIDQDLYIGITDLKTENNCEEIYNDSCIFLEFASLDLQSPRQLTEFISSYGLLTKYADTPQNVDDFFSIEKIVSDLPAQNPNVEISKKDFHKNNQNIFVEPLSTWYLLQSRIRTIIRLWRRLRSSKIEHRDFCDFYLFHNNNSKFMDKLNNIHYGILPQEIKDNINFDFSPSSKLEKFSKSSNFDSNSSSKNEKIVADEINKFRSKETYTKELLIEQIEIFLSLDAPKAKFPKKHFDKPGLVNFHQSKLNFHYSSLLSAILIQLTDAILENKKYSKCLECQKWMPKDDKGGKSSRSGKVYCSSLCRHTAYRRRRDFMLIYDYEDPKGPLSLKELIKKMIEGTENVSQYLQTKTSPKRSIIFENLLSNFILNMFSGAGIKSIAEHLSMKPELIPNIFDPKVIGKKNLGYSLRKYEEPYLDWDDYM